MRWTLAAVTDAAAAVLAMMATSQLESLGQRQTEWRHDRDQHDSVQLHCLFAMVGTILKRRRKRFKTFGL